MIINPYLFLNPIFNNLTAAYPLSEGNNMMRREVLSSGLDFYPSGVGTSGGYTTFNGSSTYITADGEGIALAAATSFTFQITLKPTALTGTRWIMAKGKEIYASNGEWSLYHSGTTLNFRVHNAAGTASTTVSVTLTNGVDNVITCGYDNTNQLISIKLNNGSLVTAAHTSGVKYNFGIICIGGPQNRWTQTAEFYNGAAKNFMFWKGTYLTSAEQSTLYGLGFPYSALPDQADSLDPDNLPDQVARFDFSDTTRMWQDTAKTVSVSANDDPIRRIDSKWGSVYAEAPSDAVRPLLKTATLGGLATAYSNGTDTQLNISQELQSTENNFTMFLIAKNDRTSNYGSHWLMNRTYNSYVTTTGIGYTSVYGAFHKSKSGSGGAPNTSPLNNTTGFNVYDCFSKSQYASMVENGDDADTLAKYKTLNTNPADWDTFFKMAAISNTWWAIGNIAEVIFINSYASVATRARVRKFLETKWSLTNVFYRGY